MKENEHVENPADFELAYHVVPGEPGRDHLEEMAEAFIIEFKRMRWTDEAILKMFENPLYAGPHTIYKERGREYVLNLLSLCASSPR